MSVKFSVEDKDGGFDELMDALTDPSADHVAVGVMADAGAEELEKAVKNEFGWETPYFDVPERPWLRRSVDMNEKEIAKKGEMYAKAVLDGKMSKKEALAAWGSYLMNLIKNGITTRSLGLAENAESTIEMKGSDTPLIGKTNQFIGAIHFEVRR